MENKDKVILQRKQSIDYTIVYPHGENGRPVIYTIAGTKGKKISERQVPYEVFDWLVNETTAISKGDLLVKKIEDLDEDVEATLENINNLDKVEESIFTQEEIREILETGNHNVLKKKLKEITEGKNEELIRVIKKQIQTVATEIGVDSGKKREVLCDWLGLDYEISDVIFDKVIEELHK